MRDELDPEDLPASLKEMVDVIGLQATLKLVEARGGVRLYVPFEIKPEHWISRLIGFEQAVKLARYYGGQDPFFIPRALDAVIAVRNREIRQKYSMGKTQAELAREYSLTERWVREIVNEVPAGDRQVDLFGKG